LTAYGTRAAFPIIDELMIAGRLLLMLQDFIPAYQTTKAKSVLGNQFDSSP
jgi:hypothetical protein